METLDVRDLPPEVSCQLAGAVFDICETFDIDVQELLEGLPYAAEHLRDTRQWIDWSTMMTLIKRFEACSGLSGERLADETGKLIDLGAFGPILSLASLLVSPVAHTRWFFGAKGMFHKYYRVLETSFTEHTDGGGFEWTLALTKPGYEVTPGFFWTIKGQAQAVIRRLGARDAVVEMSPIHRGYCFVARYSSRSLTMRLRELLSWPQRAVRAQGMLRRSHVDLLDRLAVLEAEVRRRERAEERLRQQMAEAEALHQQLARSQRLNSLGLVAGGVAHDFNNLLTGILGYAELALDPELEGEELGLYIGGIVEAAGRASELTRQLLTFGRQGETKARRATLGTVVFETTQMLERLLPATIELELERPDPADEPWLLVDAGQIGQVVMNLALNARDAMPGGGRLRLRVGAVEHSEATLGPNPHALVPGRYAWLEVLDTGEGIAAEDLERIFDPFFTTKEEGEGTGLGLSLVFGIVRRHGGMIEVESEYGGGSKFRVCLPEASAASLVSARKREARGPGPSGHGRVLLVDDDPLVRGVAERILRRAGYEVVLAVDGEEALEVTLAGTQHLELVITDLAMPRRSGISLIRELRARWPGLSLLAATGYVRDADALEELEALGVPLLHKPYVRDELLWAVHDAR